MAFGGVAAGIVLYLKDGIPIFDYYAGGHLFWHASPCCIVWYCAQDEPTFRPESQCVMTRLHVQVVPSDSTRRSWTPARLSKLPVVQSVDAAEAREDLRCPTLLNSVRWVRL